MYKIYSHTTPDGRIYIGQAKDVEVRWDNGNGYEENKDFYSAIKRFGWENIKHDIICECESKAEADFREAIFIVALDAENEVRGFNRTRIKADALKAYTLKTEYGKQADDGDSEDKENFFEKYGLPRSFSSILIDEWVFNERDRKIMKRRYLDGIQYSELADEFNLSIQRIKTIVYTNANKIKKHL